MNIFIGWLTTQDYKSSFEKDLDKSIIFETNVELDYDR